MTEEERKLALHCLKANSDYHPEVCEECINYPNCDHTIQDDVTETIIKALEQEPCGEVVSKQEVLDILKDKWNNFSDANDAMQESIDTIEALQPVTPLPQPFDLEGLKSDLKALNCGFPYGLDYLLDCLNRRLGITIIEADKAEGSDKE